MKNKKVKKNKVVKTKKNTPAKKTEAKKIKPSPVKKGKVKEAKKAKPVTAKKTTPKPEAKKKEVTAKKVQPVAKPMEIVEEKLVVPAGPERRPLTEQEKKIKALMIKKNKKDDNAPRIKLRIDSRTIITVKTKEALKMWKDKYPGAVEVE